MGWNSKAANKWIEDNLVTPITTYDWNSAIAGIGVWGQQTVDTIGAGIVDKLGWANTNIVQPLITYDWLGAISTLGVWGQQTVDTIGGAITDATGWLNTYIVTPVIGYDWKGGYKYVRCMGTTNS